MNAPTLFDGPFYDEILDRHALTGQIRRVAALMADGVYRTLREIADSTGDPEASVSAQLRHLRKERFGKHTITSRRRVVNGEETRQWEYRLTLSVEGKKRIPKN